MSPRQSQQRCSLGPEVERWAVQEANAWAANSCCPQRTNFRQVQPKGSAKVGRGKSSQDSPRVVVLAARFVQATPSRVHQLNPSLHVDLRSEGRT